MEVFGSLITRIMFPSTSFWGKPWGLGAIIAFSAFSVLFQMLPFAYWTYISMSFFWCNKVASCSSFFDFRAPLKSWSCGASIPVPLACWVSALPFVVHPRWGNGELMTSETFLLFMQWLNAVFIAYHSKIGLVVAGHQSMCFAHANRLPCRLTCLAGGVQRSCLCQRDVFDSFISRVMFPSTTYWGKPWWFGAPVAFSASPVLFQMHPLAYWTYISMSFLI